MGYSDTMKPKTSTIKILSTKSALTKSIISPSPPITFKASQITLNKALVSSFISPKKIAKV
jgi:hypothetical protein